MLTAGEQSHLTLGFIFSIYNIDVTIADRVRKTPKTPAPAEDFGIPGAPINHSHPFYFGFLATSGGVVALTVLRSLAAASQIFILIIIALFLAIGLNPAVEVIRARGISRTRAVTIIFIGVVLFVGFFVWLVIPPVVSQGSQLIRHAPTLLEDLKQNSTIATLNDNYGIIDTLTKKLASVTSDGTLLISAFGGVVGVGKTVLSGTFSALTVLILTLYFLSSLPQIISMGLRLTPASRRDRIARLTDGILSRIGTYIGSQITVAFITAFYILILTAALGLPSPFALAMVVFILDLLPLIGHSIGIVLITVVALTQSPLTALLTFLGYALYIQIENYIITPRIMRRSLSVPGLVTIISALIGATLLGLVGALLAVPLAASALLILDEVVLPRAENS